ncbi:M23 family metallopeptidase [Streptomyces sp. WI04-05B]|uniref:M23 family metallopeptidase n=1 Tax=Streptomyces TaxID=1883 RepID=UPI0029BCA5C0|nr:MULTISPECIES: M23 family metallopeptidase [unclassified Streptomyces]MDX2548740.1 M23 family metallopeptidase [Streptomyces sp. WI04-05B]MDX2590417.1 M23 family metallopeptidase [Streptomyces sp. WI04-05A]MDX3747538.1 M23 family metallopeptidase [Streptomyces sp. AK08-02]
MASNPPAPAAPSVPNRRTSETEDGKIPTFGFGSRRTDEGPWEEWNPSADTTRPVRGRHRVGKQRGGGGLARSSTVLGVGVIAAVGGAGMATAQTGKPPVSISIPDLPSVGSPFTHDDSDDEPKGSATALSSVGVTPEETEQGTSDAGEALRSRIILQAEQQKDQAEAKVQQAAQDAAARKAAAEAAKVKREAAAKVAAEKKKIAEAAAAKVEAARLASLAKQYTLPTSSYTITSTFGQAGSLWSSGYHTGLDFAAPTGTPLKAIHSGTVTEAGWSGSYGYRTILTLDDGTELWYAHQSSINVSVGQKVATGDVIGRVGATGNVTGAHLHLEVHTSSSDSAGIDPMAWLRSMGLNP